jgi:hypothetical protein
MAEKKLDETVPASPKASDYQAPVVEEVVTRDGLEREAAYAGLPVGSGAPR